jgi:hypothetical protein
MVGDGAEDLVETRILEPDLVDGNAQPAELRHNVAESR